LKKVLLDRSSLRKPRFLDSAMSKYKSLATTKGTLLTYGNVSAAFKDGIRKS